MTDTNANETVPNGSKLTEDAKPRDARLLRDVSPLLFFSILLIILSAFRPLALPDEGRYAEIGRWMWASGDWLVPRLNGLPFFHKPPLLYWMEAALATTGSSNAWLFRSIPAAHAILILSLIEPLVRPLAGEAVARKVFYVFGSTTAFLLGGQYINHDMMVACWISVAIGSFGWFVIRLDQSASRSVVPPSLKKIAWLGFVACALGVLSKGLIGLVLPGGVLIIWLCWCGRWFALRKLPWISGSLIFLIITVPWFIAAENAYPGMMGYMFGVHQFARFTGHQFNNAQPVWFYLVATSLLLGPWFIGFWAYHYQKLSDYWTQFLRRGLLIKGLTQVFSHDHQRLRGPKQLLIGLCVIWVWVIVVFFSIPSSKIIGYALPVIPPMSLLCVLGWDRLIERSRVKPYFYKTLFILSLAVGIWIQIQAGAISMRHSSADVAQFLACQDLGEYPYDLPFLLNSKKPFWVIQDWVRERLHAGDNWRREMFEGSNFEPSTGQFLKPLNTPELESKNAGRWLLLPSQWNNIPELQRMGFVKEFSGQAWTLYRSQLTQAVKLNDSGQCVSQMGK